MILTSWLMHGLTVALSICLCICIQIIMSRRRAEKIKGQLAEGGKLK